MRVVPDNLSDEEFDVWLAKRGPFDNWKDADIRDQAAPLWLIGDNDRPLMLQNALVQVVGKEKSAKTFFTLEMAFCIAFGLKFHGLDVTQGQVVYILAEGGIRRNYTRVQALWSKHEAELQEMGYTSLEDARTKTGSFILLDQTIALAASSKEDPFSPKAFLEAMGDQGIKSPLLVVLDTWARSLWQSGGHESDPLTVGPSIQQADYIRKKLGGTSFAIVAHEGLAKNGRAKGLVDLGGAVDCGIFCKETATNSGVFEFTAMTQRHAEGGYKITAELRKPLDGPSVVLVSAGSMSAAAKIAGLPKSARAWYDALASLGKPVVTVAEWLAAGKARGLVTGKEGQPPSDKAVRTAMERARKGLVAMSAISVDGDGTVTLTPDAMEEPEEAGAFDVVDADGETDED